MAVIQKASRRELIDQLELAALAMEPKIRDAFLLMVATLQSNIDLKALTVAVEARDIRAITEIVNEKAFAGTIKQFAESYQVSVERGAAVVIDNLQFLPDNAGNAISVRFNLTNPRTASFLNDYKFNKIREISLNVQETIRETATRGILAGQNPIDTARDIRSSIGLTANQERAVANYRRSLENLQMDSLVRRLRDKRFDPTIARAIKEGKPLSPERIDKMVQRYREKYIKHRAEVIAKTESIRAIQSGQQLIWQQMVDEGDVVEKKVRRFWVNAQDGKVRNSHIEIPRMNKKGVGLNEPFASPLGNIRFPGDPSASAANTINCLIPSNIVMADDIVALTRREYDGEVVTIKTTFGYQTTVTPNHPVLTNMGWLRAAEINKTHNLFCDASFDRSSIIGFNLENMIPTVEDLYESFNLVWPVNTLSNKEHIMNFHGDIPNGEVNIITPTSGLSFSRDARSIKDFCERVLLPASMGDNSLSRLSTFYSAASALLTSPDSIMRSGNLSFSDFIRHFLPFDFLRFALTPENNARIIQDSINWSAADSINLRKLVDRKPLSVLLDKVVSVIRSPYLGHVYNLQTQNGLYTANGIVQHNCRCTVIVRTVEE